MSLSSQPGAQQLYVGHNDIKSCIVCKFTLAYLASIERSPNTAKAYAHDLKDWFTFLAAQGLDWDSVTLEDVAGFAAWLRLPPAAREGRVQVLPTATHHCAESSVNRKLAALTSFCEFHARHGVSLGGLMVTMTQSGRAALRRRRSNRSCTTSPRAVLSVAARSSSRLRNRGRVS